MAAREEKSYKELLDSECYHEILDVKLLWPCWLLVAMPSDGLDFAGVSSDFPFLAS